MSRRRRIESKDSLGIKKMRDACGLAGRVLAQVGHAVRPGVSLLELDALAEELIRADDAIPAFKGYNGFPASICTSVNEELIHGIPSERYLSDGDIISIDLGVKKNGYYGDVARTWTLGTVPENVRRLVQCTRDAFDTVCATLHAGMHVGDISHTVQLCAERNGYGVVRDFVGHGIGTALHEAPQIPNFGTKRTGPVIPAGATLAIEPMFTLGDYRVNVCDDDWTVVTADGMPSAHYENTLLVTEDGCEVLTVVTE